jgi:hypothetical protein
MMLVNQLALVKKTIAILKIPRLGAKKYKEDTIFGDIMMQYSVRFRKLVAMLNLLNFKGRSNSFNVC